MVNAGRILILTKGDWSSLVTYEMLDLVSYDGVAYLARQASVGVNPSTDTSKTYWQPFGSVSNIATTSEPGLVMPDGDTIKIESSGLIYVDIDASGIDYDNTQTGITATDVQSAIDTAVVNAQMALDGIGPVETTSTASQGYSKGDFFFYNGKLYVCTLAFAQGAMIIPGTNCQLTTVGAQLKAKENKPTILTSNLAIGATSLVFTDNSIGNNSRIRVITNPFSKGLEDADQSGTTVTLTFAPQEVALSVKLEIHND